MRWALVLTLLACSLGCVFAGKDYYELLEVKRDASTRVSIREIYLGGIERDERDIYSQAGHVNVSIVHMLLQDIRRAFKKLALELHPDKNPGNPDAHHIFVQINTAFEVLKDDELRKKYDVYGEEGLKQENFQGGQYQGWQYYKEVSAS